jgi:hypothetical protein
VKKKKKTALTPERTGDREHTLVLLVHVPAYNKPEDDLKVAARVLSGIKVSIHSQAEAWMEEREGDEVEAYICVPTYEDLMKE